MVPIPGLHRSHMQNNSLMRKKRDGLKLLPQKEVLKTALEIFNVIASITGILIK